MAVEINIGKTEFDNKTLIQLTTEHGGIDVFYTQDWGQFTIANFDVDPNFRSQGIGKELLRAALSHAQTISARYIIAAITSRESLDAMRSVFGDDAIRITEEGTYHPPEPGKPKPQGDTEAVLLYPLVARFWLDSSEL